VKVQTALGASRLGPSELCRLRQLDEENAGRARKKALKPSRKRELATNLMTRYGASMRKACAAIRLCRVVYLYQSAARDNTALVMRIKEITQTRVHYGYRRVHVMLKREGFKDKHKRAREPQSLRGGYPCQLATKIVVVGDATDAAALP